VDGSITLKSLERAAEALGCTLVYTLLPNRSLEEIVQAQARQIALQRLALVEHTMRLEDQAVENTDTQAHLEAMVKALVEQEIRELWEQ
jgi:predicted DNA-binding mobile mystery protein A